MSEADNLKYETFNPKIHNTRKVASLIYDVDFRTFDMLFKSKNKAISTIEKDLRYDECLKVVIDGDEIIGILMFYTRHKKHKFHIKPIRLFIVDILDYFVLSDIKEDDFYIAEIAVDKNQRSKGYGSRIINDVIDHARKNNYRRVTLDADFRNTDARKLYEKLGFRQFNKKAFLKRGMYNMEFIIS